MVIRIDGSAQAKESPGPVRCGQPIATLSSLLKTCPTESFRGVRRGDLRMTARGSVACKVPHYPHTGRGREVFRFCTCGQTIVQSQELTTECGSKGLMSEQRPNDGSKAAKRSFKSQNDVDTSHKAPACLGSSGLSLLGFDKSACPKSFKEI
jgi:hypothetical protein